MFPKIDFLALAVLLMTAEASFARSLLNEATTKSIRTKPPDNNKICLDGLGDDYVWDKFVETCVRCTTCTCDAPDPHCVTCREQGIRICTTPSIGDANPEVEEGVSTPPPPLLTNPSSSVVSSTHQTNVTEGANTGSVVLWIVVPCVGVFVIIISVFLVYKCYTRKAAPSTPSMPQQETGFPAETHPMVVIQTNEESGTQEAQAV